ncbi:Hypothetical predicted protein, partial [Paramuricea clavata]
VDFYLLILGEYSVDQAFIHLGPDEIKLERVERCSNLWRHSATLRGDPIKDGLKYKYRIIEKGDNSIFTLLSRIGMSSKDPPCCEEPTDRPVKAHTQFDVFHFPQDKKYVSDTVPKAIFTYLKLLLPCVNPSTIYDLLNQIESLQFVLCETKHVKECVNWIVEYALNPSVSDVQRLYLCIVLGHLKYSSSSLPFTNDNKTAKACDRLLQCLNECVDYNFLSQSNLECLKKIAISLVENSSSKGWLTLAAHFYPYLGIEFILAVKDTRGLINYVCDGNEYKKMVGALLLHIKEKNGNDLVAHQYLLHLVLKHAPTLDDALELFESVDFRWFFTNEDEKVHFFVNYYQDTMQCNNTHEKTVGAKLTEFYKTPKKIRGRMNKYLFSTLLEFSTSDDELSGEHAEIFLESIISRKYLDGNQVFEVLVELSKSKSVPRQNLLLTILNNDLFWQHWRDASLQRKVEICKSWVITRVVNKSRTNSSLGGVDKIVEVYEAVDALMRCSLNIGNKILAQDVCTCVVEGILRNEDAVSVLKACASIEKYAAVVQDCYKSHVKIKLTQAPRMVKKASLFLQEFSNSSLGQDLLFYIVDIIVPEIATESENDERNFRKILDWCDIWIVLLTTTETVEKYKKYRAGKKICHQLERCIKHGNISLSFLEEVHKKKEKVSMLCASVLNNSTPNCDLADLQKQISDRIDELMHVADDCYQKFQLLESAISYGKKISNNVCTVQGIESIIETINDLKETLHTKRVYALKVDTFWGTLLRLLSPAEDLQPLVNSVSFVMVAKKTLKELNNSSEGEDGNDGTAVRDFYSLMIFLTSKAIEEFKAQWGLVLNDPGSLSVESMKTLLGTLKDENQLDEELELLGKYFRGKFSLTIKTYIEVYVKYPNVMEQVRHIIGIFNIFKLADLSNETIKVLSQFQKNLENSGKLSLALLRQSMENVKQIVSSFSGENLDCVIEVLSRSTELLTFMEEIVDEDIRFLIDAVEEHSDQFVTESSVSDLIDVHGFLAPLIKKKTETNLNPQKFLEMLKASCLDHGDIAVKIQQCSTNVNSLRGLYTSIANRGEVTKEIIGNCLNRGEYSVLQKDGKCETRMSYVLRGSGEEKTCNYSLSDLHDLRSRAHLIVTSKKNNTTIQYSHSNESNEEIDFDNFINQVNLLTEITILLSKLRSSGYVKYRHFWIRMKTTNDLQSNRDNLNNDLENWENILKNARENFYFLNYYCSDQLCTLYDFLMNEFDNNCDEVLTLVHFVDRSITKQQLQQHRESQEKLKRSDINDRPDLLVSTV